MKIDTLKDLQKVIELCRKTGVDSIRIDGIEFHLGSLPTFIPKNTQKLTPEQTVQAIAPGGITEDTRIPTNELTDEQLLMWSAVSGPEQQ